MWRILNLVTECDEAGQNRANQDSIGQHFQSENWVRYRDGRHEALGWCTATRLADARGSEGILVTTGRLRGRSSRGLTVRDTDAFRESGAGAFGLSGWIVIRREELV